MSSVPSCFAIFYISYNFSYYIPNSNIYLYTTVLCYDLLVHVVWLGQNSRRDKVDQITVTKGSRHMIREITLFCDQLPEKFLFFILARYSTLLTKLITSSNL